MSLLSQLALLAILIKVKKNRYFAGVHPSCGSVSEQPVLLVGPRRGGV